jgi:two-component system, OmpR family, KDP operon response regulator KdpE
MTEDIATILVVDDLPQNARLLDAVLTPRGYRVLVAGSGPEALDLLRAERPDLVLLDIFMPGMDGYEVCRRIRRDPATAFLPVVMITASGNQEKIQSIEAGADDFVTKPFSMDELLARVRAATRRAQRSTHEEGAIVETDAFTIDLAAKKVRRGDADVRLTPTEWHLLEALVRSPGRLVAQKELLKEVWGPTYTAETNYLRVYVAGLRRKLEPDPAHPRYLITEPGMGYRFEP